MKKYLVLLLAITFCSTSLVLAAPNDKASQKGKDAYAKAQVLKAQQGKSADHRKDAGHRKDAEHRP